MTELAGKVAIVTGAAQGIGRGIAELLAGDGVRVLVADIQEEKGNAVVRAIEEKGGAGHFVLTDVGTAVDIRNVVEAAVAKWDRLDIVVNNAYWAAHGNVEDLEEADWDRSMNIMLRSIYLFGKYAFPLMIDQGQGNMINIASIHGFGAHFRYAVYAAAKAGVINLTRQMALDYGPHHIRVNAICPGWIVTERTEHDERKRAQASAVYPLGRPGQPEDIAKAVRFLASEQSSFITGHALVVDGGLTAQLQDAAYRTGTQS